jgi:hypothetical protein
MLRWFILSITHAFVLVIGFALGVYFLPILTAPEAPDQAILAENAANAAYKAEFMRDLAGSDFLHWGEGKVSLSPDMIVHEGRLAPGPDYKLYLTTEFVENEEQFNAVKDSSQIIGDVRSFNGFVVPVPAGVDIEAYTTVVVWCEAFGEFITAARYQ